MKKTFIAFGWIIGLLFAASPVQAQETDPVPIPIPSYTVTNTYAAKFICGVQPESSIKVMPDAQAGHYSSKINVHNNTGQTILFRKKVIRLRGGQVPTAPSWVKFHSLKSDYGMEVVCRDIYRHLGILIYPQVDEIPPYIEGFVNFEVAFQNPLGTVIPDDPLDIEGIYTYRAEPAGTDAVSIDVEVFPAKRNRYWIPGLIVVEPVETTPTTTTTTTTADPKRLQQ
jgi:hypothetical protein